jgi:integrase
MARLKLTAKAIDRLRAPSPNGKQQLYWDTELRGFGVLVSGTTNGKSFVVQRDVNGQSRRVTVGATNVLTLDDARKEAERVLADFYRGVDPKIAARGRLTLRAALENYLAGNKRLRPNSVKDYRTSIERHLAPWLNRPLHEIDAAAVIERHGAIAAAVKAEGRYSGEATANGTMRCLRSIWNFVAEGDPSLPANPTRALRRQWFAVHRRERLVKADELPQFYAAVRALPNAIAADYLTMLLFTGLRREEAASLEWADIDLQARILRLPAARTKAGRKLDLPLTDYVHDLLVARRALGDAKFVFPSVGASGHISEPKFPLNQVALATGIQISAHDLRRTFAVCAESSGVSPWVLKKLLNHSLGSDVTAGYLPLTVEQLREPAQKVCDKMKTLCGVTAASGDKIVRL